MRPVTYVLLALALLLALGPLAVPKPGLPLTLKADEPAYYLAALSLARDRDLQVELHDIKRLAEEFPYLSTRNLILATDDGWRTVYYGKPYIYSLFTAPFAALAGANGMVSFNLLLLIAMAAMGTSYLRQFNPDWLALLFAFGFVFVSTSWVYGFWLHPEVFNMAAITASLYLAFREPPAGPLEQRWWSRLGAISRLPLVRATASGAALALAAYNKPMLAALGLAPLLLYVSRRRWPELAGWLGGALVAMALVCGLSMALTGGHPSAYLGFTRAGISVPSFDALPFHPVPLDAPQVVARQSSWHWIFRIPEVSLGRLLEDLKYFAIGRHTGLFVYQPFTLLCLLLFLTQRRRDAVRWGLLASLVAVALSFLLWISFNWHGGGGFVGNRYFVNAVPGFLFLVTRIRPAWTPVVGYGLGGALLGGVLLTPLGAPVLEPTLQAHVRGPLFDLLPMELSLTRGIPGSRGSHHAELYVWGRKEEFRPRGESLWIAGGRRVEVWIQSLEPLDEIVWQVENVAPDNEVVLALPGDRQRVEFPPLGPSVRQRTHVVLHPTRPTSERQAGSKTIYTYRMTVSTRTGRRWGDGYLLGASLVYLGPSERVGRDVYAVEWLSCPVPRRATAGSNLTVPLRVANRSGQPWIAGGPIRVEIGWHWVDQDGARVEGQGRARFAYAVAPGERAATDAEIPVPQEPGVYTLELEPLYVRVAWFSKYQPDGICRRRVRVVPSPS